MEININILPDYRRKEIIIAERQKTIAKLGIILFFVAAIFYLYLLGLNKVLELNLNSALISQEIGYDKAQYNKLKQYDEEFDQINSSVDKIRSLNQDQLYWSSLFLTLSKKSLPGIKITGLVTNDYSVSISGNADNRDSLLAYKDGLSSEDCFSDVNLPLSNLVEKSDITFQMDLKVKEECLKK